MTIHINTISAINEVNMVNEKIGFSLVKKLINENSLGL